MDLTLCGSSKFSYFFQGKSYVLFINLLMITSLFIIIFIYSVVSEFYFLWCGGNENSFRVAIALTMLRRYLSFPEKELNESED